MLEDRSIDVAYNLETVLAEKLETIIIRTTTNTRMRDFYDIAILQQLYGSTLDPHVLHDALLATAHKRGTERHLAEAAEVFDEVENSPVMQDLWAAYQKSSPMRPTLAGIRSWLRSVSCSLVARARYEKAWTLLQGLWRV